ncbi:MAG: guanylate kinase [bacterium]
MLNKIVRGNLYVVAAPSGAGKTSLVKALVDLDHQIKVSVSHTTRQPRPGEVSGQHYHFVAQQDFINLVGEGAFLEHAEVFEHYYGTSEQAVDDLLNQGLDVILEIDWQGARQVRRTRPDAIGIFIFPPSQQELHKRLKKRGQDSEDVIAHRMSKARDEMSHFSEFDYVVVNDAFEVALQDLVAIFRSLRLTINHQSENLEQEINALLRDSE